MPKQNTEPKLYTMQDAAEYCRLSVAALKQHYHITGDLHGRKVGRTIVFYQSDLDRFLAVKRKPGRPFASDATNQQRTTP